MALIDKIENNTIRAHEFRAAVYLWVLGEITRQNVIDFFGLAVADETQLDELSTYYTGLTATNKAAFSGRLESCNIALQAGVITKTQYKSMLGMA